MAMGLEITFTEGMIQGTRNFGLDKGTVREDAEAAFK